MKTHILIGTATDDVALIQEASEKIASQLKEIANGPISDNLDDIDLLEVTEGKARLRHHLVLEQEVIERQTQQNNQPDRK